MMTTEARNKNQLPWEQSTWDEIDMKVHDKGDRHSQSIRRYAQ